MSKIPKHVEQKLQSFFELLVPSAIRLSFLLYGRQASFSKKIQEVKVKKEIKFNKKTYHKAKVKKEIKCNKKAYHKAKVEKETKANKVVFHLLKVKVKEKIINLKVDPTFDEAIFSYVNKFYFKKTREYIYYLWVVKFVKSPLVQRIKGNHKQWVVTKLRNQIFILTTSIETTNENLVWSNFEDWFNFISYVGKI
jgi:hypothetical protein